MSPHTLEAAVAVAVAVGALLATAVIRAADAARARTNRRIHEIAVHVFRAGALREARKALVEIARCSHDRAHVELVAKKGIADSAMPAHLADVEVDT